MCDQNSFWIYQALKGAFQHFKYFEINEVIVHFLPLKLFIFKLDIRLLNFYSGKIKMSLR